MITTEQGRNFTKIDRQEIRMKIWRQNRSGPEHISHAAYYVIMEGQNEAVTKVREILINVREISFCPRCFQEWKRELHLSPFSPLTLSSLSPCLTKYLVLKKPVARISGNFGQFTLLIIHLKILTRAMISAWRFETVSLSLYPFLSLFSKSFNRFKLFFLFVPLFLFQKTNSIHQKKWKKN